MRLVLALQKRYGELNGSELASAITLAAFISLLPLLLVGIAVLGFVSANSSYDLTAKVIDQMGLARTDAGRSLAEAIDVAENSRQAASFFGLAGLLWTGLGIVRALQYTWNSAWQVRGRGVRDRAVGIAWLVGALVLFSLSFALSAGAQLLPWFLAPVGLLLGFASGVGLWLWTSKVLPNRDVGWRPLLPAAIFGAAGFELLKIVGSFWVPRVVASSSALYGSIGVVFAVLAWLLVFGRVVAYSAMLEVVVWEEAHGTVQVSLDVPARPGVTPLGATRAGQQRFAPPLPGRIPTWVAARRPGTGRPPAAPEARPSEPAET
jgi:membrane protein